MNIYPLKVLLTDHLALALAMLLEMKSCREYPLSDSLTVCHRSQNVKWPMVHSSLQRDAIRSIKWFLVVLHL